MTNSLSTDGTSNKSPAATLVSSDPRSILNSHPGMRLFVGALDRVTTDEQLIRLLGRYIQFNAIFGSGVAHLAGEIGARTDLFRDSHEAVTALGDRSIEVAASVFFAAVDEFGDRMSLARSTHRSLAQATIKALGKYLELTDNKMNEILRADCGNETALNEVQSGYGLNRTLSESDLFRGIGFHLGSETLADEEFCALDTYLQSHRPELVHFLSSTEIPICGRPCRAYHWIKMHTTAEAEHSESASRAVALALQYYAGPHSRPEIEQFITDGFSEFVAMQTRFMASLLD